ncbi:MAG: hypothetical protein GY745_22040 [Actinomycetia bacterium]|nr:hypothetical protein [Actinomycetes bacterium]MCP4087701.1 hypothetical protein [Actinomycetes bacterium]
MSDHNHPGRVPSPPSTPLPDAVHHGHLGRAFQLMAWGLGHHIDQAMSTYLADEIDWAAAAFDRMGRKDDLQASDPLFQLLVIRRFWGPAFKDSLGDDLRPAIEQLIEARNLWAHFSLPAEVGYVDRNLGLIADLLAKVDAPEAAEVRALRAALHQPTVGDTGDVRLIPEPDPDTTDLADQLEETEAAFASLQDRINALGAELEKARAHRESSTAELGRATQEIAELEQSSADLEERIVAHRDGRMMLISLFVAVLIGMALVIVLISAS